MVRLILVGSGAGATVIGALVSQVPQVATLGRMTMRVGIGMIFLTVLVHLVEKE